jgi:DNA-binding protein H-NS
MKKQETVEKNFQKVRSIWEQARNEKVENISKQISQIDTKIEALKKKKEELEVAKSTLLTSTGPTAPSAESRREQSEKGKVKDVTPYNAATSL